jgi:FkbM family methyltransferase
MNPLTKFKIATHQFRERFGNVRGSLLWMALLKEKWLPPSRIFSTRVPGFAHKVFLRAHTSDVEVFCQIFGHAELDYDVGRPVKYIIDAGANIGLSSLFLANKYPGAAIDAIEVSTDNIELLTLNVGSYPNIRIIPKGLWGKSATLKIANPTAEPWAFIVEETSQSDPEGIPTVGVNDLMQERGIDAIDILKVDIEGAEAEVFGTSGAPWLSSVNCLMIELHDHMKPGCREPVLSAVNAFNHTYELRGEYHIFKLQH